MFQRLLASIYLKAQREYSKNEIKKLINRGLLEVGSYTYGINHLKIYQSKGSESKVIIGKYCSLAPKINIITGGIHPINWVSTFPFRARLNMDGKFEDGMPYTKGNIEIGNDVWIGTNVTILSGIKIGNGAVIAAGAVVSKDVSPYAIIGGNPAKLIKYRFHEDQINLLMKIQWWNWDNAKILKHVPLLSSNNIEDFLISCREHN